MSRKLIFLKKEGAIATIYLNRPEKHNALNIAMWSSIPPLMQQVEEDPDIKVVIFRGSQETAFAAGADISEFPAIRQSRESIRRFHQATVEAEKAILHLSKPTIALIQGFCVGGGCELAVACDLRFADTTARFAITPAKLGLVYDLSATKQLVQLIGPAKAKDMLYSGRLLEADEALRIGLIDRLYKPADIERETYAYARQVCQNAQYSVRSAKYMIHQILNGVHETNEETTERVLQAFASEDHREGVQAFLEKRPPHFTFS